MKLSKVITISVFSLIFSLTVAFSQENETGDAGTVNQQQNGGSGNISKTDNEKTVKAEIKSEANNRITETEADKKPLSSEKKQDDRKSVSKKTAEKKTAQTSATLKKEEETAPVKMDGDLLPINEGNFKYKRIPDIKLADIKPESPDTGNQVAEVKTVTHSQKSSSGFLGFGVLIFFLIIFIVYRSRMSGPGNKSTKKRNVLNTYRK